MTYRYVLELSFCTPPCINTYSNSMLDRLVIMEVKRTPHDQIVLIVLLVS